jgi:hypothetical protein
LSMAHKQQKMEVVPPSFMLAILRSTGGAKMMRWPSNQFGRCLRSRKSF